MATQAGYKLDDLKVCVVGLYEAFTAAEIPAVTDLFHDYAGEDKLLCEDRLQGLLRAVGERPDEKTLKQLFKEADTDCSGAIDLQEFLVASDKILQQYSNAIVCLHCQ